MRSAGLLFAMLAGTCLSVAPGLGVVAHAETAPHPISSAHLVIAGAHPYTLDGHNPMFPTKCEASSNNLQVFVSSPKGTYDDVFFNITNVTIAGPGNYRVDSELASPGQGPIDYSDHGHATFETRNDVAYFLQGADTGVVGVGADLRTIRVSATLHNKAGGLARVQGTVVCRDMLIIQPPAVETPLSLPTESQGSATGVAPGSGFQSQGFPHIRPALSASERLPDQVSWSVRNLVWSLLIALVMLLVVFPAELFNATLEEHYDEVVGWLPFTRHKGKADRSQWLAFALSAAATAGLYAFLDSQAAWDKATLAAVVGVGLAIAFGALVGGLPSQLWLGARYRARRRIRAYPAALLIAGLCVLLSRSLGFQPGYLYGIVGGFALVAVTPSLRDSGRAATLGSVVSLALAGLAWLARIPVSDHVTAGGFGWLVLDTLLAAIFAGGLGGLIFGLVPMRFLAGHAILKWSRTAWAVLFFVGLFGFLQTLLVADQGPQKAGTTMLALFGAFALVSVTFWGYFRYRPAGPVQIEA